MKMKLKGNNKGATLILVLLVVSFILIIATSATSVAMVNYKMKVVQREAKKTFYTSETAVDELYAALGMISMDSFSEAYEHELGRLVSAKNEGGENYSYVVENAISNKNLRAGFMTGVVEEFGISNWNSGNQKWGIVEEEKELLEAVTAMLNGFIEVKYASIPEPEVVSISSIEVSVEPGEQTSFDVYEMVLYDCTIKYLNEEGYYSNIKFDASISMPDIVISFSEEAGNKLETFADYSIIANHGLVVNSGVNLSLNDTKVYAGKLAGEDEISVNVMGGMSVSGSTVITNSDFVAVDTGSVNVNSTSSLWCNGLKTSGNAGAPAIMVAAGNSVYALDDLQLDGDNSNVTVAGSYYGYGYEAYSASNHKNSSAVIINGLNSRLNMSNIQNLMIGGVAYIDYKSRISDLGAVGALDSSMFESYATGESVSILSNQEIYLVPDILMAEGKINPMPVNVNSVTLEGEKLAAENDTIVIDESGNVYEFIKDYVKYDVTDTANKILPVTTKIVNGYRYYYFNFESTADKVEYVKAIMDESNTDSVAAYMRQLLQFNINDLFEGSADISLPDGAVAANGALMKVAGADISLGANASAVDFAGISNVCSRRFRNFRRYLNDYYNSADDSFSDNSIAGNYVLDDMFDNFINSDGFVAATEEGRYIETSKTDSSYVKYVFNNSNSSTPLVISDEAGNDFKNYSGGVVVVSGNVVVKKNFKGLIIAGGSVTVEADAQLTSSDMIADIINENLDNKDSVFRNVFNAYMDEVSEDGTESDEVSISNMTYKDFVMFKKWTQID